MQTTHTHTHTHRHTHTHTHTHTYTHMKGIKRKKRIYFPIIDVAHDTRVEPKKKLFNKLDRLSIA